jgi:hypothetical protein
MKSNIHTILYRELKNARHIVDKKFVNISDRLISTYS